MLFWTKVGPYTESEFETAFGQFKATNKPFIFTYFKDAEISTGSASKKDLMSLRAFQAKLDALGHFKTVYKNIDQLKFHFNQQLGKLAKNGFIELKWDKGEAVAPNGITYEATLTGSGAVAQGAGAVAIGRGGVVIGGDNIGSISTGTQIKGDYVRGDKVLGDKIGQQINTGGGAYVGGDVHTGRDFVGRDKITQGLSPRDLETLFASLLAVVGQGAPADKQAAAMRQVEELKAEVARGKQADDSKLGRIVDGLVAMVPEAVGAVASMFATPILGGIAGPVTRYVLDRLHGK